MARNADRRRMMLAGLGIAGAGALARVAQAANPCTGTSDGTAPTGKSLQQVYDKIARTDAGFGEARVPVQSLPGSPTAQYVISAPGVYYLTANVTGEPGKSAIEVAADHVELECDGFVFLGVTGTLTCIRTPAPQRCIGVYDAGFKGWQGACIDLRNAPDSAVEECCFDSCDSTADSTGTSPGTCALGDGGVVFDCDVRSCHGALVSVGRHGVIEECTNLNGDGGCFFSAGDAVMEDNFAMDNPGAGFTIQTRGVLIGNRLVNVGGIDVGAGSVVSENDIGDTPGTAITVRGAGCSVEENYVANAQTGIAILGGGGTLVDGNQLTGVATGVIVDGAAPACFVVRNCVRSVPGGAPYVIPASSSYGPITAVAGGDVSAVPSSGHPWANFAY